MRRLSHTARDAIRKRGPEFLAAVDALESQRFMLECDNCGSSVEPVVHEDDLGRVWELLERTFGPAGAEQSPC